MTRPGLLLDLGFAPDYEEVRRLQLALVERRAADKIPDTLVLVEHDHVYTMGRRWKGEPPSFRGAPCHEIERGGDITYHGPGQLVGYPIVKLREWPRDVRRHLRRLERMLRAAVAEFGIGPPGEGPHTGLWIGGRKLASIGVAVKRMVAFHGFALNVSPDMRYFRAISPCGIDGSMITSMDELLGHPISVQEVKPAVVGAWESEFSLRVVPPEEASHGSAPLKTPAT
jgi:lipoate-protein ligase B